MEGLLDFSSDDSKEHKRHRSSGQQIQEEEGCECAVGDDEAVSEDSGQRLHLRGEGERWCGCGCCGGKKISLLALFGGNDPANKA